ncbi:arginase [Amycolatopsis sacchari]|uniref:Arginase n=1 Tax=Amycolatopsis sacchari TaxID=115433 RepID=A0A1I4B3K5_9PSEU|nr:arginase family protein [Amycolatopsis sacchari]SFK63438.1 arginase [Amycolatopsis sacchari]
MLVPYHQDQRLPDDALPLDAPRFAPALPDGDLWDRLAALHDGVAEQVAAAIRRGERPTVVSGDCLIALGVLEGVRRAGLEPSVVWFDAHGDLHTPASSTSGYVGGMALRFAIEPPADDLTPLAEECVTLVDARDLDPAEAEYLATSAVRRVPVADVEIPEGPVLLHVDLDVIDSAELPGLLFPAPDGPTRSAVLTAVRRLLDSGRVAALHVACPWEPGRDQENRRRLLSELTGLPGQP